MNKILIAIFLSASETHNKMNVNKTIEATLDVFKEIVPPALEAGSPASDVAMLARARGVPLVTGLGPLEGEGEAGVDGSTRRLLRHARRRPHQRLGRDFPNWVGDR